MLHRRSFASPLVLVLRLGFRLGLALGLALALALGPAGCGDDGAGTVEPDRSVEQPGPYAVGVRVVGLGALGGDRALPVAMFYPAPPPAAPEAGLTIEQLAPAEHRAEYRALLTAAPAGCPADHLPASLDAAVLPGPFPLVMLSHCHECTSFSNATIAIHLASHGFVVASVEHTGNTLWNQLADDGLPLDESTLAVREADIRLVLDGALAGGAGVPATAIDGAHVGVLGHSFGAVTAGKVAEDDDRIAAAFALAAPMQNPLLPGVTIANLDVPLGFLVAVEDNSITELGNQLIRDNFEAAPAGAYKIEVADAGHWSVSDLLGVVPGFMAGCGSGTRQTDGQPFTYAPPAPTRLLAAAYVTAFFRATLADDAGARAYLTAERTDGAATVAAQRGSSARPGDDRAAARRP
jgi:dienelactone hydrolase